MVPFYVMVLAVVFLSESLYFQDIVFMIINFACIVVVILGNVSVQAIKTTDAPLMVFSLLINPVIMSMG